MPYTANKKINALDVASTPLGDNDAVPMVRAGVTFQTPLSAVEAKVFSSMTALSAAPTGTESVVLRQGDGSLRQTTTNNLLPDGSITNTQIGAGAAIVDTKLATISSTGKVANSATTANSANQINTIVVRDGSGNFSAGTITANLTGNSAGTHTGAVIGNATTATQTATPRAISLTGAVTAEGVNFDGSTAISLSTAIASLPDSSLATISTAGKVSGNAITSGTIGGTTVINTSGTITSGTITANTSGTHTGAVIGNATTATQTATPRAISLTGAVTATGVNFDGSAAISLFTAIASLPDSSLATISTAGKVSGSAITSGNISTSGNIATTGTVSATTFVGNGGSLTGITGIPSGAVMPFAMNSAPTGWLAANGSAVSRTTYATLFTAIGTTYGAGDGSTTFLLPDLRGYFVRGAGTNADATASGTFGVKQADAFQGHYHSATTNAVRLPGGGATAAGTGTQPTTGTVTVTAPTTDGTNGTPRTAAETRPANIAMLYCIKS